MTDLKTYIRQLRNAADALENLLGFRDGPAAAAEIRQDMRSNGAGNGKAPAPQAGFKYPAGTHWTQTPAGRKHMKKLQRLRHQKTARPLKRGAPQGAAHHKGLHWTQKPEFKAKLAAMHKKGMATRSKSE